MKMRRMLFSTSRLIHEERFGETRRSNTMAVYKFCKLEVVGSTPTGGSWENYLTMVKFVVKLR